MRPFGADFDLRGRPPVYKTAALPIELRRPSSPKVSASLSWGRSQNHRRNQYFSNSTLCMYEVRLGAENLIDGRGVENQLPFTKAACAPPVMRKQEPSPSNAFTLPFPLISTEMLFATTSACPWRRPRPWADMARILTVWAPRPHHQSRTRLRVSSSWSPDRPESNPFRLSARLQPRLRGRRGAEPRSTRRMGSPTHRRTPPSPTALP